MTWSQLRDTSADHVERLAGASGDSTLVSCFLAHADQRTAKFYIGSDPKALDRPSLDAITNELLDLYIGRATGSPSPDNGQRGARPAPGKTGGMGRRLFNAWITRALSHFALVLIFTVVAQGYALGRKGLGDSIETVIGFGVVVLGLPDAPWGWMVNSLLYSGVGLAVRDRLFTSRTPPAGLCLDCGYDLCGSPGPTCPECGAAKPA